MRPSLWINTQIEHTNHVEKKKHSLRYCGTNQNHLASGCFFAQSKWEPFCITHDIWTHRFVQVKCIRKYFFFSLPIYNKILLCQTVIHTFAYLANSMRVSERAQTQCTQFNKDWLDRERSHFYFLCLSILLKWELYVICFTRNETFILCQNCLSATLSICCYHG